MWICPAVGNLYQRVKHSRFARSESGQTMVEYVLMVILVALVVIVAIPAVATSISGAFAKIAKAIP
jgi:Flp pilus assembly pilin Flp